MDIKRRHLDLLLFLSLAFTAGYFIGSVEDINESVKLQEPTGEVNVTCYVEAENGTPAAHCRPVKVYAPNKVVNVTTKPCEAYTPVYGGEFTRPHPCD